MELETKKQNLKGINNQIKYFARLRHVERRIRASLNDDWNVVLKGIKIIVSLRKDSK